MPDFRRELTLLPVDRVAMRRELISVFLKEDPGNGNGNAASRYRYDAESYGEYSIFLKRPTRLNKGFDFTVNIEGMYFRKTRKYSNPSHQDIFDALAGCKENYSDEYHKVSLAIRDIYLCNACNIENINAWFYDYNGQPHPIQVVLLAIKWLFMEQDCAYWNYSGRAMLFTELTRRGLA